MLSGSRAALKLREPICRAERLGRNSYSGRNDERAMSRLTCRAAPPIPPCPRPFRQVAFSDRSGVKRCQILAERPHFPILAPQFERPMVGFAGDMDGVDVVIRLDFAFTIDLPGLGVDVAEAIPNHSDCPSACREAYQRAACASVSTTAAGRALAAARLRG